MYFFLSKSEFCSTLYLITVGGDANDHGRGCHETTIYVWRNYFVGFLEDGGKIGRIEKMVEHMQYIKNLAGIDAIALGSDFDGFGELCELSGAEKMQQLASEMERQGFSSAEIDKVFSLNALRVFQSVLS